MGEERQLGQCVQEERELLSSRRSYRIPALIVHGNLAELTKLQGNADFDGVLGSREDT